MFNPTTALIRYCVKRLQSGYRHAYGQQQPAYAELITQVATTALGAIAQSDALYHDVEHTVLVTLVGQEILHGKQRQDGNVSAADWAHFIISLLCHDLGYIKGICSQDDAAQGSYITGLADDRVLLNAGATDASLTPYHVDRGKRYAAEWFADQPLLDLDRLQHHIELTRFPVPAGALHQDTASYAGLARAADLIGQLSDPRYLEKIPALFYEFEEVGTNRALGYRHPGDLRKGFPGFFRAVVAPYLQPAVCYLEAAPKGQQILASLQSNVETVEAESAAAPTPTAFPASSGPGLPRRDGSWHGRLAQQFNHAKAGIARLSPQVRSRSTCRQPSARLPEEAKEVCGCSTANPLAMFDRSPRTLSPNPSRSQVICLQ